MRRIPKKKNIALVAHDHQKKSLLKWAKKNKKILKNHKLFATGTTGILLEKELDLPVHKYMTGPLGGDQQIGASIVEGGINLLIFFWDPLEPMAHDPDIRALLRLASVWNIPLACNQASADFIISSPLISQSYQTNLSTRERP